MAKKSSALTMSRPVVVAVPAPRRAPGRARRASRAVGRAAKRGGLALARGAFEEKLAIGAVAGAGVVGYLEGSGNLGFVPDLVGNRTLTLAGGLFVAGKYFFKSQKLRMAGIGLAAAAVYDLAQAAGAKRK